MFSKICRRYNENKNNNENFNRYSHEIEVATIRWLALKVSIDILIYIKLASLISSYRGLVLLLAFRCKTTPHIVQGNVIHFLPDLAQLFINCSSLRDDGPVRWSEACICFARPTSACFSSPPFRIFYHPPRYDTRRSRFFSLQLFFPCMCVHVSNGISMTSHTFFFLSSKNLQPLAFIPPSPGPLSRVKKKKE